MTKIYDNDSSVPYKTTHIKPEVSKSEIDGILARWGIRDSGWRWDMPNNEVFVTFQIHETLPDQTLPNGSKIQGKQIAPVVRIEPPRIWTKVTRRNPKDVINWDVSMRVMFWYIKTHLEMSYLLQSSKVTEFLPYIQVEMPTGEMRKLAELLVPNVDRARALPNLEAVEK